MTIVEGVADAREEVSEFRRAVPQFCIVGVKNLILLGKISAALAVFGERAIRVILS